MKPLITIITVVYNDKVGLQRTVSSILAQNFLNWELIIKDGGSDDGTLEYSRSLQCLDSRVRVLEGIDSGIYDAMNMSVNSASGDYLVFINAGDELAQSAVLFDLSLLLKEKKYDLLLFSTEMVFEGGVKYRRRVKSMGYISYGQPAIHQSTIYRTDLHKKYLYDDAYPVSADYAALLMMSVKESLCVKSVDKVFSRFEIVDRSTSFRKQAQSRSEMARAQIDILGAPKILVSLYWCRRFFANFISKSIYKFSMLKHRGRDGFK